MIFGLSVFNPARRDAGHSAAQIDNDGLLVLEPGRSERHYWSDLWRYRELFAMLAWRDVSVRYKQTIIGIVWAAVRPFLTMAVFTVVFGRLAKLPSTGAAPYPLMVFAGMLPWFLFSTVLSEASNSLVSNSSLVGKVYFPRMIIPAATVAVSLIDLAINLGLLALLMAWFGFWANWRVVVLPVFVGLAVLASLGPALLLSALTVKYRDFRYVIPFVVQFGLYISPVGFVSTIVPAKWRLWYDLNPMVGPIDGFRWCLLGTNASLDPTALMISVGMIAFLLWIGTAYFRSTERGFADVI